MNSQKIVYRVSVEDSEEFESCEKFAFLNITDAIEEYRALVKEVTKENDKEELYVKMETQDFESFANSNLIKELKSKGWEETVVITLGERLLKMLKAYWQKKDDEAEANLNAKALCLRESYPYIRNESIPKIQELLYDTGALMDNEEWGHATMRLSLAWKELRELFEHISRKDKAQLEAAMAK